MKKIICLFLLLALCACESEAEHKAKWVAFCQQGEFSNKQCEVLYSLKKSSEDADATASMAVGLSAASMGVAAARK